MRTPGPLRSALSKTSIDDWRAACDYARMKKGFWTLIEELGPSLPDDGDIEWSASLSTITDWLSTNGLPMAPETVTMALDSAAEWNPGWPWDVTREGERYRFRPAKK